MADEYQIHPCRHGLHSSLRGTVVLGDGVHLHTVADDQSAKAHSLFQQSCDDPPGHGGGQVIRLQLGKQNMGGGHCRAACINESLKRPQLHLLQLFQRFVNTGQAHVGVHGRIPVAGEMLGGAQNAALLVASQRR